jgi:membrane protein DedA with SNARE-associated domain
VPSVLTLQAFISTYGYVALFWGTFLGGEAVLIIAGFAALSGYLQLPWVIAVAFVGSLLGDQMAFWVGKRYGMKMVARYPRLRPRVQRMHRIMSRYHNLIMLGFRFVYGMRLLTPFVLGLDHNVRTGRFLLLNSLGAGIWSVSIALGGYFFGLALEIVLQDIQHYEMEIIAAILGIAFFLWLVHRLRRR